MLHARPTRCLQNVRRFLAGAGVLLVLVLGVLAQDAALHRQLHDATATTATDDGCVIDLFAHGVSMAVGLTAAPPVVADWRSVRPVVAPEIFLELPRHLRPPECGPPVA